MSIVNTIAYINWNEKQLNNKAQQLYKITLYLLFNHCSNWIKFLQLSDNIIIENVHQHLLQAQVLNTRYSNTQPQIKYANFLWLLYPKNFNKKYNDMVVLWKETFLTILNAVCLQSLQLNHLRLPGLLVIYHPQFIHYKAEIDLSCNLNEIKKYSNYNQVTINNYHKVNDNNILFPIKNQEFKPNFINIVLNMVQDQYVFLFDQSSKNILNVEQEIYNMLYIKELVDICLGYLTKDEIIDTLEKNFQAWYQVILTEFNQVYNDKQFIKNMLQSIDYNDDEDQKKLVNYDRKVHKTIGKIMSTFNEHRKYGYIKRKYEDHLFFYKTAIVDNYIPKIEDDVIFKLSTNNRGLIAIDVCKLGN